MPADSKVKHHLPPNGFAPDGRRSVGRRAGDTPEELLPPKAPAHPPRFWGSEMRRRESPKQCCTKYGGFQYRPG